MIVEVMKMTILMSRKRKEERSAVQDKDLQLMRLSILGIGLPSGEIEWATCSLFLFSKHNRFRKKLEKFVKSNVFGSIIGVCIILSSIQLAIESPLLDPEGKIVRVLYWCDVVLSIIFSIECTLKIAAFGFLFNGRNSYMRSGWNFIDFIIVLFSSVSILATNVDLKIFKVFRLLRILRPLRVVSTNQNLKLLISSLIMSIPSVIQVILVTIMLVLILGITGVAYFKGTYFECAGQIGLAEIDTKWDCINSGGEWVNAISQFNDVPVAMVTIFHMSTTAGWAEVMYHGMHSRGIDL